MRIKLTKTICDNAKPNNKRQFLNDSEHIGLNFVIGARRSDNTCSKSWYYTYRPKGQNPTKIYLAPYPSYSVAAARLKAKQVQRDILDKKDPFLIKQSLKQELTLGELIGEFYQQLLNNTINQTPYRIDRSKMSDGGILSIPLPNTIQPLNQFHSIKPLS